MNLFLFFLGASSILEFAKLQAASKALLDLYKRPSNPTVYFVGGDCTPPEEDYAFMEEETFQHLSHKNDMVTINFSTLHTLFLLYYIFYFILVAQALILLHIFEFSLYII